MPKEWAQGKAGRSHKGNFLKQRERILSLTSIRGPSGLERTMLILKKENIERFTEKLSKSISFKEYDDLTREIWVSYMPEGRGHDYQIFRPPEP